MGFINCNLPDEGLGKISALFPQKKLNDMFAIPQKNANGDGKKSESKKR
jgi:hypothetical protein